MEELKKIKRVIGKGMEGAPHEVLLVLDANTVPEGAPKDEFPALGAVNFYTDFANPEKEVYSWNDKMPDSLQAAMATIFDASVKPLIMISSSCSAR